MTAKEYLSQAMALEARIDGRMEQLARLRAMVTRGTRLLTDMPLGGNHSDWTDTVAKIQALEAELNEDVRRWVELKRQICAAIDGVERDNYRQLLEYRYLCGWDWRRIADAMHYSIDRVWHIHSEALKKMQAPEISDGMKHVDRL